MDKAAGRQIGRRSGGFAGGLLAWGPVVLWMAAIFYVSSQNTWTVFSGPPIVQLFRKSGHLFEYAVLGLLVGRALTWTWTRGGGSTTGALLRRTWIVGSTLCAAYAATDELHQLFVPKRVGYVWDVLVDTLSAVAALGIWYIVRERSLARHANPQPEQREQL